MSVYTKNTNRVYLLTSVIAVDFDNIVVFVKRQAEDVYTILSKHASFILKMLLILAPS